MPPLAVTLGDSASPHTFTARLIVGENSGVTQKENPERELSLKTELQ